MASSVRESVSQCCSRSLSCVTGIRPNAAETTAAFLPTASSARNETTAASTIVETMLHVMMTLAIIRLRDLKYLILVLPYAAHAASSIVICTLPRNAEGNENALTGLRQIEEMRKSCQDHCFQFNELRQIEPSIIHEILSHPACHL